MRTCPACSHSEPGPWHVRAVLNRPGATPPPPLHIGCCAARGCATCTATVAEAGGLTGQPLLDHLAAQRAARTLEVSHG